MPRVLIVDDQPNFRRQLRELLNHAGWDVVGEASCISEAETLVRVLQPDLAVVDVMLPEINGLNGTPRLKQIAPTLRVILLSAYHDQADIFKKAAHEAGAETFISKDDLDIATVRAWRQYKEGGKG